MIKKTGARSEERGARKTLSSAFGSILNPRSSILTAVMLFAAGMLPASGAFAGAQREEALSASVRAVLQRSVSDQAAPKLAFGTQDEADKWLKEMSRRLWKRIPDAESRLDFLSTVHYEAKRASLGRPEYPNLVRAAWHNKWTLHPKTADSGHRPADG